MSFSFRAPVPSQTVTAQVLERQLQLTKPAFSLGRLEELAVQMAGWQERPLPIARPASCVIFAADHPVTRHQVSPFPSAVTRSMVQNFLGHGAACSVLSCHLGLPLSVVDVGVDGGAISLVAHGPSAPKVSYVREAVADLPAGDLRCEDAMSHDVFEQCLDAGRRAVQRLPAETRVFIPGEMGIGNTTVAAAICAALIDERCEAFVGAGTGAPPPMIENKVRVVQDAVARLTRRESPIELLRRVGGREVAAMVGAMAEALERRQLVLVDGFIASSAALVLCAIDPGAKAGLIWAHRSKENGHRRVLEHLGVQPLLDLGLCLGEASGALVAFTLLEQACALHARMATFASAGVPGRE